MRDFIAKKEFIDIIAKSQKEFERNLKNKQNIYVPNTALKIDIRDITNDRKRIISVLKKNINEKLYKNITYLNKKYQIENILQNQEINKKIDINNILLLK